MENVYLDQTEAKKGSFISLLGYAGLSEEEAEDAYNKLGGDIRKMTHAIQFLSIFTKLDAVNYLKAVDYLASDDKDSLLELVVKR